ENIVSVRKTRFSAFFLDLHGRVEHQALDPLRVQPAVFELNEALAHTGQLRLLELAVGEADDEDDLDERLELSVGQPRRPLSHALSPSHTPIGLNVPRSCFTPQARDELDVRGLR